MEILENLELKTLINLVILGYLYTLQKTAKKDITFLEEELLKSEEKK